MLIVRSFRLLSLNAALAFVVVLPALAPAQAPLPIYTDYLVNGFQDWSWGTRNFANTDPVHSGGNSISANFAAWQGISVHHAGFNTAPYDTLIFWANGGPGGGQVVQVYADLEDNSQGPAKTLSPLPAGVWQEFTLSLSSLGVADKSNLSRITFQLTSDGSTGPFYLDDLQLTARPAPSLVHLSANADQAVRSADARWFGVNTAMWDGNLDTSTTITLLQEMGTRALRGMGGSASDEYHWASTPPGWQSSFANLVHVATNIGAQVFTTVNYGTGSTNEAAAWVAYANGATTNTLSLGTDQFGNNWQTVGYWASLRAAARLAHDDGKNFLRISRSAPLGFKYWEIGNECYGPWETDGNAVPHDPFTYATRARDYINLMKAVDSTIKVGVVVSSGESSYSNNANHFAINPRTGTTNYGWTPVMLATLKSLGVAPDFAIYHYYAEWTDKNNPVGSDSDPLLLQCSTHWAVDAADLRQQLTDYLSPAGANVELVCTENNSDSGAQGKQSTSLVNGVYYADSLAQFMQTEFNAFVWWDLRNGTDTYGWFDDTLYGWRTYGDLGLLNGLNTKHPTFYAAKLMQYFAQPGDTVLSASSDYLLLSAYAARHASGAVSLLVLNKDTTTNFQAQILLSGFAPSPSATILSYGIPQDEAARTNGPAGAQDIATNTFASAGTSFDYTFPALSLTLFTFAPGAPALVVLPPPAEPGGEFVFQLRGQPGARYYVQNSTNLSTWTTVSTNWLTGTSLNLTNPAPVGAAMSFWRALWQP